MLDALRNILVLVAFLAAPVVGIASLETYQSVADAFYPALSQSWAMQTIALAGALWNSALVVILTRDLAK